MEGLDHLVGDSPELVELAIEVGKALDQGVRLFEDLKRVLFSETRW